MNNSIKVLVAGSGSVVGLSATRLISQYNGVGEVIAANTSEYFAARNYATKHVLTPDFYFSKNATEEDYLEFILSFCEKHNIDVVVPCSIFELDCLSQNVEKFSAIGTLLVIESTEYIRTFFDKYLTTEFLNKRGDFAPISGLLNESEADIETTNFPCFIKPRFGYGSNGITIVRSAEEYLKWLSKRRVKYSPYIKQELLNGAEEEYSCSVLYDKQGRPFDICAVRRINVNKVTVDAEYDAECKHVEKSVMEIAGSLKGRFCLNLQFRMRNGRPRIFEINPRFGASEAIRAQFGHDPFYMLLRQYFPISHSQEERYGRVIRAYKEEFFPY